MRCCLIQHALVVTAVCTRSRLFAFIVCLLCVMQASCSTYDEVEVRTSDDVSAYCRSGKYMFLPSEEDVRRLELCVTLLGELGFAQIPR